MHAAVLLLNRGRGSGVVARQHVRALLAAGHRVSFLHPHMNGGVQGAHNIDVPLHSAVLPVHEYLPRCPGPQRAVSDMTGVQAMRYIADYVHALASLDAVDVVVAHHANLAAVAARIFANVRGVPYVLFVHGTGIEPRARGGYSDAVWDEVVDSLMGAAGIVVTTDYVRDALVRPLVDLPRDRFLVLPCGVDVTEFQPAPWPAVRTKYGLPEVYVICPGALTPAKGPQNVVAASAHFADLAPTVFIGGGDLRPRLEAELGNRSVPRLRDRCREGSSDQRGGGVGGWSRKAGALRHHLHRGDGGWSGAGCVSRRWGGHDHHARDRRVVRP